MTAVPMCEAGQGVAAVTAVAREAELAVGNQWIKTANICCINSESVLCRRPCRRFSSSRRYSAISRGNAHRRVAKGTRTSTVKATHLCPQR